MSWGHGEDKFKRMLPNILRGKTRGKKTLWENPSGKPKIKNQLLQKMKRGDVIMGSLRVVFQEVRKCLQRARETQRKKRVVIRVVGLSIS